MNETMTLEALRQQCPALLATHPASGVSEKYVFQSTEDLVKSIMDRGWHPVQAKVQVTRERSITAKHVITFERPNSVEFANGLRLRVMVGNSHDRTMRRWACAGILRMVCSNGLIVMTNRVASIRSLHLHASASEFLATVEAIAASGERLAGLVSDMSAKSLSRPQQLQFASDVLKARYGQYPPTISSEKLLTARRVTDEGDSAWLVMNRVQENLIQGGVIDGRRVSKPIASVTEELRLNGKIWTLAESYLN